MFHSECTARSKSIALPMKHKLQTHFFLTYFIMALVVILLYSIFFYHYTSEILIERETKNLQELNNSFLSQTDALCPSGRFTRYAVLRRKNKWEIQNIL